MQFAAISALAANGKGCLLCVCVLQVIIVQTILGLQCLFAALVAILSCRYGTQVTRRTWSNSSEESAQEDKGSS